MRPFELWMGARLRKRLAIGLSVACSLLMTSAAASDNAAVAAFARANGNKFTSEISTASALQVGSLVAVGGRLDSLEIESMLGEYNQERRDLYLSSVHTAFQSLIVSNKCKTLGSYVGENAFGVKRRVTREYCERVVAFGEEAAQVSMGKWVPMTPEQYRRIKRDGVVAEFDMTIGKKKGITVELSQGRSGATLNEPVDSSGKTWFVYGRIEAVRWLLPGESKPTLIWKREQ